MQPLGENGRRRSSVSSPAVTPKGTPIGLKASPAITSKRKLLLDTTGKKIASFVQEAKPNPRRSLFSEKEETNSVNSSYVKMEPESAVPIAVVPLPQTPRSMRNQRRKTMYAISSNPTAEGKPVEVPSTLKNTPTEPQNGRKRPGTPLLNTLLVKRAMHTPQSKLDEQPEVINPAGNRRRTLFTPNKVIEYRGNKSSIKNNNDLFLDTSSCGGLIETTPPHGKLLKIFHRAILYRTLPSRFEAIADQQHRYPDCQFYRNVKR